jgi:hypothetical protein
VLERGSGSELASFLYTGAVLHDVEDGSHTLLGFAVQVCGSETELHKVLQRLACQKVVKPRLP